MNVHDAIETRRAYRSLVKTEISDELIVDLAHHAQLAPSCFNKQPWHFVFVREQQMLKKLFAALSKGNEWVHNCSMIVAVFTADSLDCTYDERPYAQFDTGMATAFLLLRATELGLVAHPIAGFAGGKVIEALSIPADFKLVSLVIVGARDNHVHASLAPWQKQADIERPERKPFNDFAFIDSFK